MARTIALVVGLLLTSAGAVSAKVLDLTSGGSGSANGALFFTTSQQPTGAGFIDPFVRLPQNGGSSDYNTDGQGGLDSQALPGNDWTQSFHPGDARLVNLNGTDYREFILDGSEKNSSNGKVYVYSLKGMEIYLSGKGATTATPTWGRRSSTSTWVATETPRSI